MRISKSYDLPVEIWWRHLDSFLQGGSLIVKGQVDPHMFDEWEDLDYGKWLAYVVTRNLAGH